MNLRFLSLTVAFGLSAGTPAWAQVSDQMPPNTLLPAESYPEVPVDPQSNLPAEDIEYEDKKKIVPYEYPQAHMFEHPIIVGQDQLRLHNGYWQPGGYQVRDGSPFFNTVPGAPPRGPIAGGGGDNSVNPAAGAGISNPPATAAPGTPMPQNYYAPAPSGAQQSYSGGTYGMMPQSGYQPLGGMLSEMNPFQGMGQGGYNPGPGAGPGGDPYEYHYGPGYYRSGEYGHFRFPYYSYRRPWYFPGFSGYNRDTNLPW